jgi:hypothetical protein
MSQTARKSDSFSCFQSLARRLLAVPKFDVDTMTAAEERGPRRARKMCPAAHLSHTTGSLTGGGPTRVSAVI